MKFKFYDIVSHLVPGFIFYIAYLEINNETFDKDFAVPATAIAFVVGYFINTIASWLEGFYYLTWGGKPSNKLLDGKGIWKIKFYQHEKVKEMLTHERNKQQASNDELFQVAMRYATPEVNSRVQDFNVNYAFSRVILTTILIVGFSFIYIDPSNLKIYLCFIPILFIAWYRSKQRAYYYAKEVLNTYLKCKA